MEASRHALVEGKCCCNDFCCMIGYVNVVVVFCFLNKSQRYILALWYKQWIAFEKAYQIHTLNRIQTRGPCDIYVSFLN